MAKVSIVLPFYNAEKFLSKCIESILAQTYTDFELILVNDGSVDCSGKIAQDYAKKDSRVQLISKNNTGVSDSRNVGMKKASGEFLMFVDADDWLANAALDKLVHGLIDSGCDLATSAIWNEYTTGYEVVSGHKTGVVTAEEALIALYNDGFFRPVVWGKLYRTAHLKKHNILFDPNIHYSEDVLFVTKVLLETKSVVYFEEPLYHYFMDNQTSALHQPSQGAVNPRYLTKWDAYCKMENLLSGKFSQNTKVYREFVGSMQEVAAEMQQVHIRNGDKSAELSLYLRKHLFLYWIVRKKRLRKKISVTLSSIAPRVVKLCRG